MNVLVMSISKKVPLLQAVKKALTRINPNAQLFGADANDKVIGKFFVDVFWKVPFLEGMEIQSILTYCKENHITLIIPTRDGELAYFASYQKQLEKSGISVMVSNQAVIHTTLDKFTFFQKLKDYHLPVIETTLNIDSLHAKSYVVKERFGSGSTQLALGLNRVQAVAFAKKLKQPIFQPYYIGEEFSIDLYVNKQGEVVGVIVRSRDFIENGESQITTIVEHRELEQQAIDLVQVLSLYGHVVLQAIVTEDGNIHFIECNARFGGASTLSIAAGLDSFYWFFLESIFDQKITPSLFKKTDKNLSLMRYAQDYFVGMGDDQQ
ncbi:carbamoyl-phosphate synthase large subunit [Natronobacillus azotifigens]|uniref:ATP-grasp domain-containing protein n=1 Tax=Natronobacillus azotifigens TaxID=472978 RepID=A0A9J6R9R3_9BACI|nr:ATP-grasp domain-containing protein [Natronobacillus azotifigens]MCZ0702102.1 ATP-grasp domain-containing protein [Natronobacillus azotifigens]